MVFAPFMPLQTTQDRKLSTNLRSIIDAVFYLRQSGCQ